MLDLSYNRISSLDDVSLLRKHVPHLLDLDLSWNPLNRQKSYRRVDQPVASSVFFLGCLERWAC